MNGSKFKVGDVVVCGAHRNDPRHEKNKFKGRTFTIIDIKLLFVGRDFTNDVGYFLSEIGWDWIWDETELSLFEKEPVVINSNQVCASCNLPAPHALPNHDTKYICKSCVVLETL